MISRRRFLEGAAFGTAVGMVGRPLDAAAAGRGPQIFGTGRVHDPLPDRTIPSPSDFGFTAHPGGGAFVCSMFGPETGGFRGCNLMTVQGVVLANSLQIHRHVATFSGQVAILVSPDVFTNTGPVLSIAPTDFTVEAKLGGPGVAYMILHIPAVTSTLGGDTGGIISVGRIEKQRIHT